MNPKWTPTHEAALRRARAESVTIEIDERPVPALSPETLARAEALLLQEREYKRNQARRLAARRRMGLQTNAGRSREEE